MGSPLAELLAQKAALEKQIADVQRAEKTSAIAQVRELMARHGLTLADLNARAATPAPRAGNKAPIKYRDKVSGNTWSGRGLQPNWLKAELAKGRKLADFAV